MSEKHRFHSHTLHPLQVGGPGWDDLLDKLGIVRPAGPPPIPPIRREQFGGVYSGVRMLKPWWRRRLLWAAALTAAIVVVSVVGGLIAGHFLLGYIEQ